MLCASAEKRATASDSCCENNWCHCAHYISHGLRNIFDIFLYSLQGFFLKNTQTSMRHYIIMRHTLRINNKSKKKTTTFYTFYSFRCNNSNLLQLFILKLIYIIHILFHFDVKTPFCFEFKFIYKQIVKRKLNLNQNLH